MTLIELIYRLEPDTEVTLEIVEETAPAGMYARDILERYPHVKHCEVVNIYPAWYTDDSKKIIPILGIEVSGRYKKE